MKKSPGNSPPLMVASAVLIGAVLLTGGCDSDKESGVPAPEERLVELQSELRTSVQDRREAEKRAEKMASSASRWQLIASLAAGGCLVALFAGTLMGSAALGSSKTKGDLSDE